MQQPIIEKEFSEPIDAFSVRLPEHQTSFRYQYSVSGLWSSWQTYENDGDSGAGEESELLMVPQGTTSLRVEGLRDTGAIHQIVVSREPVKIRVAATNGTVPSGVITRRDWGAEETYMFNGHIDPSLSSESDTSKGDNGVVTTGTGQPDLRVSDCNAAVQKYGSEFSIKSTVKKDASGKVYRWPIQYSPSVKLLVVHHSALAVSGDPRPAVERVRALYKYHAVSKGWGDIGYHFIVDEDGGVYEGRAGGAYAVGGHAYCNNVGTIGIVLMGNFELESPSQLQAKALQRLLGNLANQYGIDTAKSVQFHGKTFPSPIVGHRDLLSTLCPGFSLAGGFSQIVMNVQTAHLTASVTFPEPRSKTSPSAPSRLSVQPVPKGLAEGLSFIGRTAISINPSGKQRLSFTYTAGEAGAYEGKKIADVRLSDPRLQLLVDDGIDWIPVTKGILLPTDLPAHETANIQLIVVAPVDNGTFWMEIGGQRFTVSVYGRRARTGEFINPFSGDPARVVRPTEAKPSTKIVPRVRPQSRSSATPTFAKATVSRSSPSPEGGGGSFSSGQSGRIRIRLSNSASPTITFPQRGTIDGTSMPAGTTLTLLAKNGECLAMKNGERFEGAAVLRLSPLSSGVLHVSTIAGKNRSYRGTIECRLIAGTLTLINELPLEDYMAGLAEEPDSEPYEKQRAFAIAARTYAAYYMAADHRKFPGLPYDGSDSPAEFQAYAGVEFTANNPNWQRAVTSTAGNLLRYNGEVIKPPYFSSDDGRTRSPSEAGWKNFPFSEIFMSKPDPWCSGQSLRGHGVGMSGCGAKGQALEGRSAEQILQYYYPKTRI